MLLNLSFWSSLSLLTLIAAGQGTLLSLRQGSNNALDLGSPLKRALPNAPDGYTPQAQDCPSTRPRIRSATGLSRNETSWLKSRRSQTIDPMRDLLGRSNITGFDAAAYITDTAKNITALPNIAIAFSGGGYRAMLNGAGALKAFDTREANGTAPGHLGGLLQASTYVTGLSGGSWLVGSIFANNFTTVNALQTGPSPGSAWELENSIFEGPATGGLQLLDTAQYFNEISDDVSDKKDAHFNTSVTDYWGRALSFQLLNDSNNRAYTWSSLAFSDSFQKGSTPMPIVIADERAPGESLIPGNTTVYEFNPWEMGSFDPTTYGFVPLEYLGSNFSRGTLPAGEQCVRGFDNAGYVMGTSSSLFNQFLLQVNQTSIPDLAKKFINSILTNIGQDNNDIADYSPNPFYHYNNATSRNAQSRRLTLVDGGEDFENIPLQPLIQPFRAVDVIFAIDSSADTDNYWPNATSLVATYQRSLDDAISNGTSFPAVPDQNTIVNLGLNTHPTFFGCNSSNTTSSTPLIVYLPNSPYIYHSNVSTFTSSFTTEERDNTILNGYAVATMGNATVDSTWPICVGCAILQRSMERTGTEIPDACTTCFNKFCWDGTVNSTEPAAYNPPFSIGAVNTKDSGAVGRQRSSAVVGTSFIVALWMVLW